MPFNEAYGIISGILIVASLAVGVYSGRVMEDFLQSAGEMDSIRRSAKPAGNSYQVNGLIRKRYSKLAINRWPIIGFWVGHVGLMLGWLGMMRACGRV